MRDNEIVFCINNIRGHAFLSEPFVIKFDKVWYKLIPVDEMTFVIDDSCGAIEVVHNNRRASKVDRLMVVYNEVGLKAVKYNGKYYIAQFDGV